MKNFLVIIFLICAMQACKPGVPEEIIQPDKMALILHDIHIADGYISSFPGADSSKEVAAAYYKGIYKKFKIDSALYIKSMDYYYKNPEIMTSMYETIVAKLDKEKEDVDKANILTVDVIIDTLKVRDSLNSLLLIDTAKIDTTKIDSLKKKLKLIQPKNDL